MSNAPTPRTDLDGGRLVDAGLDVRVSRDECTNLVDVVRFDHQQAAVHRAIVAIEQAPGDLIVIPKGTVHGGSVAASGRFKALSIHLPPQAPGDSYPAP